MRANKTRFILLIPVTVIALLVMSTGFVYWKANHDPTSDRVTLPFDHAYYPDDPEKSYGDVYPAERYGWYRMVLNRHGGVWLGDAYVGTFGSEEVDLALQTIFGPSGEWHASHLLLRADHRCDAREVIQLSHVLVSYRVRLAWALEVEPRPRWTWNAVQNRLAAASSSGWKQVFIARGPAPTDNLLIHTVGGMPEPSPNRIVWNEQTQEASHDGEEQPDVASLLSIADDPEWGNEVDDPFFPRVGDIVLIPDEDQSYGELIHTLSQFPRLPHRFYIVAEP